MNKLKALYTSIVILGTMAILTATGACTREAGDNPSGDLPLIKGEVVAELTAAPFVPPRIDAKTNTKVIVELEIVEQVMRLADGVEYNFWTFGGVVPGKFIRVRQGDLVEFHLHNHPDNMFPHNIDLHAVTGPGGGAEATLIAPGKSAQFSFRALNEGLYVYHCATAPVGMHVANGMYGLILVEPLKGMPPVDHEFYVMQSEFYTTGKFGERGLQEFDMQKALDERPDYVVMNGAVGANTGDNAMVVNVGETVRLFLGNGGPNLVSSFHAIGEIFDKVYIEGGSLYTENVQTTLIPAGGSAMVEFKCEVPGTLHLVDHSIFRAFNKGAIAQIKVVGEENYEIFSGLQKETVYLPEGSAIQKVGPKADKPTAEAPVRTMEERMEKGEILYTQNCMACHMVQGRGVPGVFPPLYDSDYLQALDDKGIGVILDGLQGEITVNGNTYNNIMPAMQMSDDNIASVMTYIFNALNNGGGLMQAEDVRKWREKNQ